MTLAGNNSVTITNHYYAARRFAATFRGLGWLAPADVPVEGLILWYLDQPWAASTRRSYRTVLRGFFAALVRDGVITASPAERLPQQRASIARPRPAGDPRIAAGLVAAEPRTQLMIELMAYAGLRRAETAAVRREDVQGDPGSYALRVLGKGLKLRIVPISDYLGGKVLAGAPGYVFPGRGGGHVHVSRVNQLVTAALGGQGITPHMLRHRFATTVYQHTRDIRAVQELLGHASVATTQIYVGVNNDTLRAAAATAGSLDGLPAAA